MKIVLPPSNNSLLKDLDPSFRPRVTELLFFFFLNLYCNDLSELSRDHEPEAVLLCSLCYILAQMEEGDFLYQELLLWNIEI